MATTAQHNRARGGSAATLGPVVVPCQVVTSPARRADAHAYAPVMVADILLPFVVRVRCSNGETVKLTDRVIADPCHRVCPAGDTDTPRCERCIPDDLVATFSVLRGDDGHQIRASQ